MFRAEQNKTLPFAFEMMSDLWLVLLLGYIQKRDTQIHALVGTVRKTNSLMRTRVPIENNPSRIPQNEFIWFYQASLIGWRDFLMPLLLVACICSDDLLPWQRTGRNCRCTGLVADHLHTTIPCVRWFWATSKREKDILTMVVSAFNFIVSESLIYG